MRARVHPHMTSPRFLLPTFTLERGWSELDLSNADVVQDLRTHVGTHVELHPDDLGQLEPLRLGLNLQGRLVTLDEVAAELAAQQSAIADQDVAEARRLSRKEERRLAEQVIADEAARADQEAENPIAEHEEPGRR